MLPMLQDRMAKLARCICNLVFTFLGGHFSTSSVSEVTAAGKDMADINNKKKMPHASVFAGIY